MRDEFKATGMMTPDMPEFGRAKELAKKLALVMETADGEPAEVLAGALYSFLAVMCMKCAAKGQEEGWLKSVAFGTYVLMQKNHLRAGQETMQ